MADGSVTKRCPRCKETKALDGFYVSPKGRRSSWCRTCDAVYRADYYEQHRDRSKERRGAYSREYMRRRREADPELRLKSIKAVRAFWTALPPAEQKRLNKRKKMAARYGLSLEAWQALYDGQGGKCALCAATPKSDRDLHIDHCHGTGRVRGLLCLRCNTSLEWFESVRGRITDILAYLDV